VILRVAFLRHFACNNAHFPQILRIRLSAIAV
jgi:hypothetical protein